ncbi:unnamed protein product [Vitrella brassicaformis CCMP3155]|uniref:Uncharacterized protein n=1 Tax=Vitrella brassicaformis (strain CCMP3155) TaxID=1169540 RepID=A0A0G4H2P6_VITBC|nr:unnamed protein product [Vitrella brassicaformis CCMP3155]|eukprot:CEM37812.1 unnamed protein product [Vitrella brassicaformis CCMP3155]
MGLQVLSKVPKPAGWRRRLITLLSSMRCQSIRLPRRATQAPLPVTSTRTASFPSSSASPFWCEEGLASPQWSHPIYARPSDQSSERAAEMQEERLTSVWLGCVLRGIATAATRSPPISRLAPILPAPADLTPSTASSSRSSTAHPKMCALPSSDGWDG